MHISKNTKNNGLLTVKEISQKTAKEIIVNNHYSKKWGASFGKINLGIFQGDNLKESECLGVATFGSLMNPTSVKKISDSLEKDNVLELNRLWVDDCLVKNAESVFLSLSFKYIKKFFPEVKVIQSFADGRLGVGTIYKATNFSYYGRSKATFYEHISGEIIHRVNFVNTRKFPAMLSYNLLFCLGEFKKFDVYSYRYLYFLDKKIKKTVKLKEQKYPEYQIGVFYDDNHVLGLNALARVQLGFEYIGLKKHSEIIKKYINKYHGNFSKAELKNKAKSNLFSQLELDSYEKQQNILQRYYRRIKNNSLENREILINEYYLK